MHNKVHFVTFTSKVSEFLSNEITCDSSRVPSSDCCLIWFCFYLEAYYQSFMFFTVLQCFVSCAVFISSQKMEGKQACSQTYSK